MNPKRIFFFMLKQKKSTWKKLSRKLYFLSFETFSPVFSRSNSQSFSCESTGNEDNTKNHKQEPKLSFLVKAIYTMAYGLQAYHEDVCGKDFIGVCPQLQKSFNHSIFFVSD